MPRQSVLPISCDRDCGGGCPLLAHIRDGKVVKITDNPVGDRYMRGCVKGYRLADTTYSPDRLLTPLLRTGPRGEGHFRQIPWSEALDRVAEKLLALKHGHGSTSVLPFSGSGSCRAKVHNTSNLARRFFSLFGGFVDRMDSYSCAAADYTANHLFGTRQVGIDPETLEHSRLIILWGANVCSARLFSSRLPSILSRARSNGTTIVVIDPRLSKTAKKLADQWIAIRPGTDSAMMAAILYKIKSGKMLDRSFVEKYTYGFNNLIEYIMGRLDGQPKTPAWASGICGVPEHDITALARQYGSTKPAALLPGLSIQRVLGGEENYRFTTALQAATGNIGIMGGSSGGASFQLPSPRFPSIPIPKWQEHSSTPVYLWADMVLKGIAGGYPADIKAIYSIGSNFLNQGSDISKNICAFQSTAFIVTHDLFMTPTARFSDIVLPATTSLEREDVVSCGDNRLYYSSQAIDPIGDTRNDYDILCSLAKRLGFGQAFSEGRSSEEWLHWLISQSEIENIDEFKHTGIYVGEDQDRIGLKEFIADPESAPLNTPSGKIEIRSDIFAKAGASPIPEVRIPKPDPHYPLTLITPHSRYRINSQNSNLKWTSKLIKHTVTMNHDDGVKRGLHTGDRVRVESAQGTMEIGVTLDQHVSPGCVVLFQGGWTDRDAEGIELGAAVNSLTTAIPTYPSKGSRTHTTFVDVRKAPERT